MLAIAMTIGGIYCLVTGKFSLTSNTVVRGWKARVIGAVLASYYPVDIVVAICVIGYMAANNIQLTQGIGIAIDVGVLLCVGLFAVILGVVWGKPAAEWDREAAANQQGTYGGPPGQYLPPNQLPPSNPDNPYQPPYTR
jgi:hypothetical protein